MQPQQVQVQQQPGQQQQQQGQQVDLQGGVAPGPVITQTQQCCGCASVSGIRVFLVLDLVWSGLLCLLNMFRLLLFVAQAITSYLGWKGLTACGERLQLRTPRDLRAYRLFLYVESAIDGFVALLLLTSVRSICEAIADSSEQTPDDDPEKFQKDCEGALRFVAFLLFVTVGLRLYVAGRVRSLELAVEAQLTGQSAVVGGIAMQQFPPQMYQQQPPQQQQQQQQMMYGQQGGPPQLYQQQPPHQQQQVAIPGPSIPQQSDYPPPVYPQMGQPGTSGGQS